MMKKQLIRNTVPVAILIMFTFIAIGYTKIKEHSPSEPEISDVVSLKGSLTKEKIFSKGDGRFGLSIEMMAQNIFTDENETDNHVDMVIVLDKSGSMSGKKMSDAQEAIIRLLSALTPYDRFGLVAYSDTAVICSDLIHTDSHNKVILERTIRSLSPSGGTNLGSGLQCGISLVSSGVSSGNRSKIILISDGLANQGITAIDDLSKIAQKSAQTEHPVSTVGVGSDFNEQLMTHIADMGMGSYYFLETPESFFTVFEKEFYSTRKVAASGIEIRIPLTDGIVLVNAAGYPITVKNNVAFFYPGDLLSGSSRKLFLEFTAPSKSIEQTFHLEGIAASYMTDGKKHDSVLNNSFQITCVDSQDEANSSIVKKEWEEKVLQDEYNTLKETVAREIQKGNREQAVREIENYREKQSRLNSFVGSSIVAENIDKDLPAMKQTIYDTFSGNQMEIISKQKKNSKCLQYEAYQGKRSK